MPTEAHRASDFLKTLEDFAAYLNATIEGMDDPRSLMKAFRNVAEALGGVRAKHHGACGKGTNAAVLERDAAEGFTDSTGMKLGQDADVRCR